MAASGSRSSWTFYLQLALKRYISIKRRRSHEPGSELNLSPEPTAWNPLLEGHLRSL